MVNRAIRKRIALLRERLGPINGAQPKQPEHDRMIRSLAETMGDDDLVEMLGLDKKPPEPT